ncbi:SRPBCC family protein [Rhodococcus opacus]|uniref:SRPBCC family protein n=1 Tax=Rhodococcus opacus TaxID=37919 RepID=UPI00155A2FC1|nr:SRPBCC family protein [Rhodococcus opacus]
MIMSVPDASQDRIEREIQIDAPIERVFRLVSEPGWFIGDGEPGKTTTTREGDVFVVDFPPYGRFPILPVKSDAPYYVSFRGGDDPAQPLVEGTSTLVEFFLSEQDGGTLLRVVETGFAALYPNAERRAAAYDGNIEGWEMQLAFAKRHAERGE